MYLPLLRIGGDQGSWNVGDLFGGNLSSLPFFPIRSLVVAQQRLSITLEATTAAEALPRNS